MAAGVFSKTAESFIARRQRPLIGELLPGI
jgi:hypothetical protein